MWGAKLDYTVIYLIDWCDDSKVQFPLLRSCFIASCSQRSLIFIVQKSTVSLSLSLNLPSSEQAVYSTAPRKDSYEPIKLLVCNFSQFVSPAMSGATKQLMQTPKCTWWAIKWYNKVVNSLDSPTCLKRERAEYLIKWIKHKMKVMLSITALACDLPVVFINVNSSYKLKNWLYYPTKKHREARQWSVICYTPFDLFSCCIRHCTQ